MNNPLRQLKYLPWLSLFQAGALAALFAIALEMLLILAVQADLGLSVLNILLAPPLGMLMVVAIAILVGALSVYLLERFHRRVIINTGVLWALVLCVMLELVLKSLLPLQLSLVNADQPSLIGVVLGVFWQGRRYWR